MRICHIGQHEFPEDGAAAGIDAHVRALSLRLARKGHPVTVYTYAQHLVFRRAAGRTRAEARAYPTPSPVRPVATPFRVRPGTLRIRPLPTVGGKLLSPLLHALAASVASAMGDSDVVHYHGPGPALFAWLPRLTGKKVLTSFHGLDWKRRKWGVVGRTLLRTAEVNAVRASHRIVCDSHEVQTYCADRYGIHAQAIPNGTERFPRQQPNLIRERFGLKPDGFILYLGRLVPEKRVHWLIEAYASLSREHDTHTLSPPPRRGRAGVGVASLPPLVIAGCADHTAAYVHQLRKRADSLGPRRVIFTGRADRGMAQELYGNARLFVLPSEVEGCPIALLEAMSVGCPCVASDIPAHREIIRHGETGWLFRSDSPRSLRETLATALRSPRRRTIGERTRLDSRRRWTWDRTTRRTLQVYQSLAGGTSIY